MKKIILLLSFTALLTVACNKKQKLEVNQNQLEKKQAIDIATNKKTDETSLKVTKTDEPILGIDVSHFQGDVNWKKIKEAGIQFCYAKATQGSTYKDPKFTENKVNTIKAALLHGAYHFYVAKDNPKQQAHNFLSTLTNIDKRLMLLPMLDLEQGSIKNKITDIKSFQNDILLWLNEVEKELGVKPIIYTNNPFAKTYLVNEKFSDYKLWLAEYGVKKPKTPITWKSKGWSIWQRSERGKINGATGNVDHDIVNKKHSLEDFLYLHESN